MPTYKLDVFVTDAWPYELKQAVYSLCIAKKVNSSYSVVWTAMQDYEFYNEFRWEDSYKLGTIQMFEDGKNLVKMAAGKKQPVTFGQTVVRDHKGILNVATGAPSGKPSFTLQNEGGPTFPIVDQLFNNEFKTSWSASLGMIYGYVSLELRPKVLIFFQKGMKTGDMFATIPGAVCEIDFTGVTEKAVSFVTSGSQRGGDMG
ncbi:hypothetical protein EXIGLDRAFT_834969 [Exidia glandulosa HHB12029]|uniref:Uncharacterized protein n=1 Tax=Exidia glandulosa HHB12029 TaxID=1314781 RepID=A0A165J7F3_EXIGL|nr:hypothetical protein EXIGLDRAFT_834969 [Exidia glandulosa HHB12029]